MTASPTNTPLVGPGPALGFADVLLFCVGSGITLRWIAVAAGGGPSVLTLFAIAFIFFYIPLIAVVAELSSRFPAEGGAYLWTRETLGEQSGFMCGWTYWVSNLPYLPGLLFFSAGVLGVISSQNASTSLPPLRMFVISAAILVAITALNIIGLKIGKWITNIGSVATWCSIASILVIGGVCAARYGSATPLSPGSLAPEWTSSLPLLWSTAVFALTGVEGIALLRSDVRGGHGTLVRALVVAGLLTGAAYIVSILAMLSVLAPGHISRLSGVTQLMSVSLHQLGWSWLFGLSMLLLFIGPIGTTNSWYVACARLPFVGGMNAYLPERFGRLHPRFGTPHHSMLLQTILVLAFLGLSQAGSTARQTYDFLIRSGILLATVPYLYIFRSYIAAQRRPPELQTWLALPKRAGRQALGLVGLAATISAIGATLVPDADDPQPLHSTFKLVFSAAVLFGTGAVLYGLARLARRQSNYKVRSRE